MVRNRKKQKRKIDLSMALNIAVSIVFSLLLIGGIILVKDKLLYNADEMGTNLAQSYAAEEENRIELYELLMNFAAIHIEDELEHSAGREELQRWLALYSQQLKEVLGEAILDPYAVIDGDIIAAEPWEGDVDYDYMRAQWYRQAIAADGDIIFTNAYTDAITGKEVITISKKLQTDEADSGSVIAFDILLEKFHMHKNKASMPKDSSYFLYDEKGNLIHAVTDLDLSSPETVDYTQRLREAIRDGQLQSYSSSIRDLEDQNRGVYYDTMPNGWLSVITIPIQNILHDDWNRIFLLLTVLYLLLFLFMLAVIIKNNLQRKKNKHTEDTLRILGDTYYAIYRINYERGTYESVKSSDDVKELLGKSGSYSHLIQVVKTCVSEKTYEEFEQSFSLENIKKLIADRIYEFGGDYQRKFHDEYKWVSIRIIYNDALNLNEVIMCFREIDAEKRNQLERHHLLENSLKSAKQTVETKNTFFSNVSHDMRTPLNAIIGLSQLALQDDIEKGKSKEYLIKIKKSGEQLLSLVNDVLDMSRIEHGEKHILDYKPMDLKVWLDECVSLFEETAKQEQKSLHTITRMEHTSVYCDGFRMNQILNNLLSNGLKYSRQGDSITVELKEIARQNHSGKYQLIVRDTGIGMSEEFLAHIFEPFARETTFAPVKIAGTGLGMAIVKSLVQQLSGEIGVQSSLGQGTVVTVTLPLQTFEQDPPAIEAVPPSSLPNTPQDSANLPFAGKKILVAEDNEINMEIVTECLSALGAQVIPAWTGKEALDLFQRFEENTLDAILMDMQMPEMDGCTASKEIRSLSRSDAKTIPIIAVTANAFAEDIAKTSDAGMNAHIAKPIDFHLLSTLLTNYFQKP